MIFKYRRLHGLKNNSLFSRYDFKNPVRYSSICLQNRSTMESNPEETMKNILEENTLFEQIGTGLNRDEIYW